MLRKFVFDRSGNFAILGALLSLPLVIAAGLAVDYARYSASHKHLQELADMTSLTLAASKEQNKEKLQKMAEDMISANRDTDRLTAVTIANLITTADDIDLELHGSIPATFMTITGHDLLPSVASALAQRATMGNVEVALILDNTYSMKGEKLTTLKSATANLINELVKDKDEAVRMALVPYGDYVNVGTGNRNASWLNVGADYTEPAVPCTPTGKWITTQQVCIRQNPNKTCTRVRDGVTEEYQCGGCAEYETRDITPRQECTGGKSAQNFKWFGCVGSRAGIGFRLHDDNIGSVKYPGRLETSHKCLNPIVQLTSNKATLLKAANDMIVERSSYFPNTYIPAGLIWGLNVLSPGAPFEDSGAYDPSNLKPRKVAVLMTDGENTLRYDSANGAHSLPSGGTAAKQKQLDETNSDTKAICDNMKAKGIEIFSVAFMVDDPTAKAVLEYCAADSSHYYDATDSASLLAAFSGIGQSLRVVRLAR